jgi:hypothetical protein
LYATLCKDYSVLAVLVGLGIPALLHLRGMSEQLKSLDDTIKREIKPELKELRESIDGKDGLRTEVSGAKANL